MKRETMKEAHKTVDCYKTFEDLEAYQLARDFRKAMYAVSRKLPELEKFGLVSQIRRAAVSLTNNIAEGHGRYHYQDQIRFLLLARGSLEELIDDLNVCSDESYLPEPEIRELKDFGWRVHKVINGYGRYLRTRNPRNDNKLQEDSPDYVATKPDEEPPCCFAP